MRADSIISNTITQDIRLKGHQSIRFAPDGFSVLVSDAGFKPVFLHQYTFDKTVSRKLYPAECSRILEGAGLLNFEGETVIIVDSMAFTVVPDQFADANSDRLLLEKAGTLTDRDQVLQRHIRNRGLHILYAVSEEIVSLKQRFSGQVQTIHSAECLISVSDQIRASDHQRGVVIADVQPGTLDILVIREDQVKLVNRYALKDSSDFIYHTLNTLKQLKLDREHTPVYLSGIIHPEHELFGVLCKYIRHIHNTPYYLEELTRTDMLRHMILSEGSKCV